MTGLDADDNDSGLTHAQALCRRVVLDANGQLALVAPATTASYGSETSVYPLAPAKCPDGMVVVGYDGSDTSLVRRIRLSCAPLSWNGTDYALGSPQNTASLGRSDGNDRGPWTCAAGQVAAGMQGRSGTLLDHFQLRCYALAPTY